MEQWGEMAELNVMKVMQRELLSYMLMIQFTMYRYLQQRTMSGIEYLEAKTAWQRHIKA
ncbi:hypothetical protein JYA63_03390 [Fictibacillus nanhaiensis]|uniref:Uncharacterized protein n=1 Tax=Fictibacillus nanhaiensis TaxID=742169 RepID=A0ABS2ZPT1_9BACL|nr:hypothetical protein [Fictibacillus nanhaiensis]